MEELEKEYFLSRSASGEMIIPTAVYCAFICIPVAMLSHVYTFLFNPNEVDVFTDEETEA